MMPCPLCGAGTTFATIEAHIGLKHPEAHIHLLPELRFCPHLAARPILIRLPQGTLDAMMPFGVPVMVN